MTVEQQLTSALRGIADATSAPEVDLAAIRGAAVARHRRVVTVAVATGIAAAVVALGLAAANIGNDNLTPQPAGPAPSTTQNVPVWYDDVGLHRGDVVEQTPVDLREMDGGAIGDGALALVRTGALYLDPVTDDVWFQPWGGEARVVGHDSSTGPSASPESDVAAWFEGDELVVYDTAANAKVLPFDGETGDPISDWRQRPGDSNTCHIDCYINTQPGNGFLEVTPERVIWTAMETVGPSVYSTYVYDVRSGTVSQLPNPPDGHKVGWIVDTYDGAAAYSIDHGSTYWDRYLVLDMPGEGVEEYPNVTPHSRFSPSGRYVLSYAAGSSGSGGGEDAAIIDTKGGTVWAIPQTGWSWVAWSYGDIALLNPSRGNASRNIHRLLACDPEEHSCTHLPVTGPVLMPTS